MLTGPDTFRQSHWMEKVKGFRVYELAVPLGKIEFWEEFVGADMEVRLVEV